MEKLNTRIIPYTRANSSQINEIIDFVNSLVDMVGEGGGTTSIRAGADGIELSNDGGNTYTLALSWSQIRANVGSMEGGTSPITIDPSLSPTSTNPVQNKAIAAELASIRNAIASLVLGEVNLDDYYKVSIHEPAEFDSLTADNTQEHIFYVCLEDDEGGSDTPDNPDLPDNPDNPNPPDNPDQPDNPDTPTHGTAYVIDHTLYLSGATVQGNTLAVYGTVQNNTLTLKNK